ncbi:hypothetical protein B0X69_04950 [Helicobacter pylori]|uniref:Uncharacterized protein n=1 Tax=Helicobacter pylori TaxID=210 RepID=A0A4Y4X0N1_HELPX|nr:hypothetical protein B0X69_04950 [Helicobacter pylori]
MSRGAFNKFLKHSFLGFIFGLLAPYHSILVFKAIFLKTIAFLKSLDFKLFGFFVVTIGKLKVLLRKNL